MVIVVHLNPYLVTEYSSCQVVYNLIEQPTARRKGEKYYKINQLLCSFQVFGKTLLNGAGKQLKTHGTYFLRNHFLGLHV